MPSALHVAVAIAGFTYYAAGAASKSSSRSDSADELCQAAQLSCSDVGGNCAGCPAAAVQREFASTAGHNSLMFVQTKKFKSRAAVPQDADETVDAIQEKGVRPQNVSNVHDLVNNETRTVTSAADEKPRLSDISSAATNTSSVSSGDLGWRSSHHTSADKAAAVAMLSYFAVEMAMNATSSLLDPALPSSQPDHAQQFTLRETWSSFLEVMGLGGEDSAEEQEKPVIRLKVGKRGGKALVLISGLLLLLVCMFR